MYRRIFILIVLFTSCVNKNKNFKKVDEWEKIQKAVKKNNIAYLLDISSDSLQCIECNNGKNWVKKEAFYKNNLEQMNLGNNENYGSFTENIEDLNDNFNQRIRISYSKVYEGNKYDIIYTILKNEERFEFQGVFSIP